MATSKQRNPHPTVKHEMRALTEKELRFLRAQVRYLLGLRTSEPIAADWQVSKAETKELRLIAKTFVEQDY